MKLSNLSPCLIYHVTQHGTVLPEHNDYYLHWHDDLQFILVTKGTIHVLVNGCTYTLHGNDAIFISSNLLHMIHTPSDGSEYISIIFPASSLSSMDGLSTTFVQPYISNYALKEVVLSKSTPWQSSIIEQLNSLYEFNKHSLEFGKEYELAIRLQMIWLQLIRNVKDSLVPSSKTYQRRFASIQTMLSFIHKHYEQDISLSDIYESAQVSQAECCRIFKQFLATSPYDYLIQYRLHKSKDLLQNTELPIVELSALVGFRDCSHFIQQFKRFTSQTPKAYRSSIMAN